MENKVTVEDLDALVAAVFAQRDVVEEKKKILSEESDKLDELKAQATKYLEELGRENYKTPKGTLYRIERWRVSLPKTDKEKSELFDHLRERGLFEALATVNSNSLNSLWNKDFEAAKDNGEAMTYKMPGVSEPKLFVDLGVRKN